MKLAEVLIQRKDVLRAICEINKRILGIALMDRDDIPAYNPQELLDELEDKYVELELLMQVINRTNANVMFDDTRTISDVLAERDVLAYRQKAITKLMEESSRSRYFFKYNRTFDVRKLSILYNTYAKSYRELDAKLQRKNWQTDIVE